MRKIAANLIFDGFRFRRNAVLTCNGDGTIVGVDDLNRSETPSLEYYSGLITPGFFNMHQHLELAWMHRMIQPNGMLSGFIRDFSLLRQTLPDEMHLLQAMKTLDAIMYKQGVSVVVDIANTESSLPVKVESRIKYFTMIELFDKMGPDADTVFSNGTAMVQHFIDHGLNATLTPHAFYSVSEQMLKMIEEEHAPLRSIHFLESPDELEMLVNQSGFLYDLLSKTWDASDLEPRNISNVMRFIQTMLQQCNVLLVHNTSLPADVLRNLQSQNQENLFFCLCPNSNNFITGCLPNPAMFVENAAQICIGTDSPASNHSLSFVEEMKTLQNNYADISLNSLLRWCTSDAARALGLEDEFGCFKPGSKPGIVLITNVDTVQCRLTEASSTKRLL